MDTLIETNWLQKRIALTGKARNAKSRYAHLAKLFWVTVLVSFFSGKLFVEDLNIQFSKGVEGERCILRN